MDRPLFLIFACLGLIPGLVGGIGLLRSRSWARAFLLIPSTILLPLLPIGTAIGIYGFWTLLHPETSACMTGSPRTSCKPSTGAPSSTRSLLGVMACVAAGFFLFLKAGFAVHHDPPPMPFNSPVLTATALLVFFAGALSVLVGVIQGNGRVLSKEAVAYSGTSNRTMTCAHLEEIEQAMQRDGIDAYRQRGRHVSAKCRIDFPALCRAFPLAWPVRYAEFHETERGLDEYPTAYLICDTHMSMIRVVHPDEVGAQATPWFPSLRR